MQVEAELVKRVSPEEEELERRRLELATLVALLTERELLLTTCRAELAAFEGLYLREVGSLYAELDDWLAKIAELIASRDNTPAAKAAASDARQQADDTAANLNTEIAQTPSFIPSPDLKSLFKEVVRAVHPDRAHGESDRLLRERLMKKATQAYARGDGYMLRSIIAEYASSPESVRGTGIAADLERLGREMQQIQRRLGEIDRELEEISGSDLSQMKDSYDYFMTQERNLLTEMAADVRKQIATAQRKHAAVTGECIPS